MFGILFKRHQASFLGEAAAMTILHMWFDVAYVRTSTRPTSLGILGLAFVALTHQQGLRECDRTLLVSKPQGIEYQSRGAPYDSAGRDRCEGTHPRPVAGNELRVVSLVRATTGEPTAKQRLIISWRSPIVGRGVRAASDSVRLVATSLRTDIGFEYQMDAAPPLAQLQYVWPASVFSVAGLSRADFGVLGSTRFVLDSIDTEVLLPVDVRLESTPTGRDTVSYTVTLIPSVRLVAVDVTISPLDDSGRPTRPIGPPQHSVIDYTDSYAAVQVRLPRVRAGGLYLADISARHEGRGTSNTVFVFSHSPDRRP